MCNCLTCSSKSCSGEEAFPLRLQRAGAKLWGLGIAPPWCVPTPAPFYSFHLRQPKPRCDLGCVGCQVQVTPFPAATSNTTLPWDAVGNSLGGFTGPYWALQGGGTAGGMLQREAGHWSLLMGTGRTGFVAVGMVEGAYTRTGL